MKIQISFLPILNFILILLIIQTIFGREQINEYLNNRELDISFRKNYPRESMEYEIVTCHEITKRTLNSEITLKFEAFNKNYSLYLEETKNLLIGWSTPMFIARTKPSKLNDNKTRIVYDETHYPIPENTIKTYHDHVNEADVTFQTDSDGRTHINGEISGCLAIRSLPEKIEKKLVGNRSSDSHHRIMVIQKKNSTCNQRRKESEKAFDLEINKHKQNSLQNQTVLGDTIYPEILVVTDYETYEAHEKNFAQLATYMAAFWNAVDLRFRELSNPKVRLNIAGLVVTTDKNAEPYMRRDPTDPSFFSNHTLHRMAIHFYKRFSNQSDIIVAITHRSLRKVKGQEEAGLAFVREACQGAKSSAIVRDFGGFEGVTHAAHELGHVLGAVHDGERHYYGNNCSWNDGYMMGQLKGNKNKMHWSQCSVQAIQNYSRTPEAECLRNKPNVGGSNFKTLPGKLLNRDQQCEKMFPGYKSFDETNCHKLSCRICMIWGVYCYDALSYRVPPAEGTSCGQGYFCLNGECVEDPGVYD